MPLRAHYKQAVVRHSHPMASFFSQTQAVGVHDCSCARAIEGHENPGLSFPRKWESTSWDMSHATVSGFLFGAGMTKSRQRLVTLREVATAVMYPNRGSMTIRVLCRREVVAAATLVSSLACVGAFRRTVVPVRREARVPCLPQAARTLQGCPRGASGGLPSLPEIFGSSGFWIDAESVSAYDRYTTAERQLSWPVRRVHRDL